MAGAAILALLWVLEAHGVFPWRGGGDAVTNMILVGVYVAWALVIAMVVAQVTAAVSTLLVHVWYTRPGRLVAGLTRATYLPHLRSAPADLAWRLYWHNAGCWTPATQWPVAAHHDWDQPLAVTAAVQALACRVLAAAPVPVPEEGLVVLLLWLAGLVPDATTVARAAADGPNYLGQLEGVPVLLGD